jgi:hypothetical protein
MPQWWPFRNRLTDRELVASYENSALARRKIESEIEIARLQLEQHRIDVEMEHLEAVREQNRKDAEHREQMRELRAANAARMREVKRQKRELGAAAGAAGQCAACRNPGDPRLTVEDITFHANGHRSGPPIAFN